MTREKGAYSVQAVIKAIDLLETLAQDGGSPSLVIIEKKLDLSRNKAFRLLATLEDKGLVERNVLTGTYSLGLQAFQMAQHILGSTNLIRLAHPVMEELAHKLNEAIYITVMNNDEVLFLDMVDSFQQVKAVDLVGRRFPFFTNAAGKVLKSVSSIDLRNRGSKKRISPIPSCWKLNWTKSEEKGLLSILAAWVKGFAQSRLSFGIMLVKLSGR